jgi:MFS family permease
MLSFGSLLMAAGAVADDSDASEYSPSGSLCSSLFLWQLGLASNVVVFDVLRAMQGVAAAAALAGGSAALAHAFSLLGKAFGVRLAFGPVLAGFLIGRYGWRSVYLSGSVIGHPGAADWRSAHARIARSKCFRPRLARHDQLLRGLVLPKWRYRLPNPDGSTSSLAGLPPRDNATRLPMA